MVLLAGEILKEIRPFVEDGVAPQTIIKGLRKASQLAVNRVKELAVNITRSDPTYVSGVMCFTIMSTFLLITPDRTKMPNYIHL